MSPLVETIVDWLSLPMSGASRHVLEPRIAWHGRAMALAWGILLPVGALTARYFKILPGQDWPRRLDHRFWWRAHLALQYFGVALTVVGVALVWRPGAAPAASAHAWLGWAVATAAILQVAGGWLRGSKGGPDCPSGDHYAMTVRRIVFERVHKALGWVAIMLGLVTIALGLRLADAPRWMPVVLALWWSMLAGWAAFLQSRGWCSDTYQAIWGPSPDHPGNRIPPIGWGVRRGATIGPRATSTTGERMRER